MITNRFNFPSLPSTNDWAKEHLHEFERHQLTIIQADEQTAGRGRFGRKWVSPKGLNLYQTFVFFVNETADPLRLTHLLALTFVETFPSLKGQIKWPNDILCGGKKVAGILCETVDDGVILGIGVNVNLEKTEGIDQPATSFLLETGKRTSIKWVSDQLTDPFKANLILYKQQGFTPFIDRFAYFQL